MKPSERREEILSGEEQIGHKTKSEEALLWRILDELDARLKKLEDNSTNHE